MERGGARGHLPLRRDGRDNLIAVAPDGDIALLNGLLAPLAEAGAVDADYVTRHVNGFDETLPRDRPRAQLPQPRETQGVLSSLDADLQGDPRLRAGNPATGKVRALSSSTQGGFAIHGTR